MANLFITIVPTKQKKNGQHKVRIAISHNAERRKYPNNSQSTSQSSDWKKIKL